MKLRWNTLGGKLGLFFCVAGLAVMWAGWNGAASYNDIRKQFPYLISGGLVGLALVVIGVGLMIIQSQRADRVQLEANLNELRLILERLTGLPVSNGAEASDTSLVVAGPGAYHRPTCKLVAGRDLRKMTVQQAESAGLEPCRTCAPDGGAEVDLAATSSGKPQPEQGR
ncbi:MAG TPA: hypothetical protein VG034_26520 [Acidimicrobiia bacterium]|jgi:hypothetical protein|nr:hypothetical protein [Acidimicrobiia bacterium]